MEDWERFYEWSEAVIPGATDWPEERRNQLQGEMITFLVDLTTDAAGRTRATTSSPSWPRPASTATS